MSLGNDYFPYYAQQGWQCPQCRTIYSPMTPQCYRCAGMGKITCTEGTTTGSQPPQSKPIWQVVEANMASYKQ